jgi:(R,R)-butanediol dehydrogenase/meso-butanediol dehydrogenase/diacetyl reductase
MKAVVFQRVGAPLQVQDAPTPRAGQGELVFKVGACGICASDLHAAETNLCPPGVVFGHEYAGEVVEVGPGVSGWKVGDRMVSIPGSLCGTCAACAAGRFTECSNFIIQGFDPRMPGAYAEYCTCLAGMAMKIPATLSDQEAVLAEPMSVGLGTYKRAAVPLGASALIIGSGMIGLAVSKWARFFGVGNLGVSEVVLARLERARKMDFDVVIDAGHCENPVAEYERQTGCKPSVIFECVGRPMIQKLIEIAPFGCHLVLAGTGMQLEQFTVLSAAMKQLTMSFTFGFGSEDFPFAFRMMASRRINLEGLVTGTVSLDETPEMFARLQKPNDHCKVLVTP